jgi:hypothetical protein
MRVVSTAVLRLFTAVLLPVACTSPSTPVGSDRDGATKGDGAGDTTVTWHGAAKPVLDRYCTTCHQPGGIGPMSLTTYSQAKTWAAASVAQVNAGLMPPWMPSASCRSYLDERRISPAEVATLNQWLKAGTPEGSPAEAPAAPTTTAVLTTPPDVTLQMPTAYTPKQGGQDDYRCFSLGGPLTEELWVRALRVQPKVTPIVHHVLVFLVPPGADAALADLEAKDATPGWTCFGGPGVNAETVGAWVPGMVPHVHPNDTATRLVKGGRLVMQVHYNLNSHAPEPDSSTLQLWTHKQQPKWLVHAEPLANLGIVIPAGDKASKHEKVWTNKSKAPWTIVGTTPHMHQLGKRIAVSHIDSQSGEHCLVDIPKWDFHWQQGYWFLPEQPVVVQPGESVRLTCEFDNSEGSKPVTWGESTTDEMCLNYLQVKVAYTPYQTANDLCKGFNDCYGACGVGVSACTLQCSAKAGGGCAKCVFPAYLTCVSQNGCPGEAQKVIDCVTDCNSKGGDVAGCITQSCGAAILGLDGCAKPIVAAGTCDAALGVCGASWK